MSSNQCLGDIAQIVMGQSPSGDNCNTQGAGTPLLNGPTEFGPTHPYPVQYTTDPKKLALPGDLLFCVRGSTTGRMNWANRDYAIGRGIAAIRGIGRYPNRFVRALIETNLNDLLQKATGSTFPNVSRDLLSGIQIPQTREEEAIAIASILEPIDDRITLLRETNATLEAIAQAIFKSWFVDFDPVRAKQEGRIPEGMDEETAALFPDGFEESELGMIPRGWGTGKVGSILERLSAKVRYKKEDVDNDGMVPVYEQGAGLLLGYHNGIAQFMASAADPAFIFGDHTCITHLSCEPFDISQNVIPLRGKSRPTMWVYYAVKDKQTFQEYRRHWMELVVKETIMPPRVTCDAFARVVTFLHLAMEANSRRSQTLSALRDTLLPRLISGQLRIHDAEAIIPKVT